MSRFVTDLFSDHCFRSGTNFKTFFFNTKQALIVFYFRLSMYIIDKITQINVCLVSKTCPTGGRINIKILTVYKKMMTKIDRERALFLFVYVTYE